VAVGPIRQFEMHHQGHVPRPERVLRERGTLDRPLQGAVQHEPNKAHLRHVQPVAFHPHLSRQAERGPVTPLAPEPGEARPLRKERPKRLVQIADPLLKRLGVALPQPRRLRLTLQNRELPA
jgi:hypothetical protein